MIKVTFEFLTVDAAIVALGKLSSAAPRATEVVTPGPAAKAVVLTPLAGAEPKQRKGRSDKGQPRKNVAAPTAEDNAHKANSEGKPADAAAPDVAAQVAVAVTPATPSSAVNTPAAATPTIEQAQDALSAVFAAHGLPRAQEVMSRFGVTRLRDMLPEQRADFIKLATETAAQPKGA